MDTLLNYLEAARGIAAVNPKHQKLVNRLAVADRKVDFHVDAAALAEEGKGYGEFDAEQQAAAKKHLRAEEKWFGVVQEIEQQLPKREIANTYKQLHANIFAAGRTDDELKESGDDEITIRVTKEGTTAKEVESYLPSNFRVDATVQSWIIVKGFDYAGWTAEGYVIPRLASGMIRAVIESNPRERLNDRLYIAADNLFVAPELDYEQSQFRLESARYASSLRMLHNRLAKIKATLNSDGQL